MKAAVLFLTIVAVGAGIYFFFIADSPAYKAYKSFSSALAYGDTEAAGEFTENTELLNGTDQNRYKSAGGMPVDALTGIGYKLESETKNPDGTVTVQAIQSVRFDPPGATSAMGAMISRYRQSVTMSKSADHWLVTSFQNEFLETRNWKGEKE